ncbi:MAG: biotin--[acetyl-CoA-carboxylase] ligase [Desulfobulbaceae bacterium]|nr:biotin--[acetyl-CoA-carboxylase] ligase [Desulfobulbaceae bacterium]
MQLTPQDIPVVRYADVVSTNLIALEYGAQGAAHGTVIAAVQQSGGRGRLGRSFSSPPGGLYFSLILRPEQHPDRLSLLTLAVGLICCSIVEKVSGLDVKLKWPNDLYLANKKLGGILSETAPYSNSDGKVPFLVVGIGLNINTKPELFPQSLQNSVISLYSIQKSNYDLDKLMTEIVVEIDKYVCNAELMKDEMLHKWKQRDYLYGKQMCWHAAEGKKVCGTGAGLLADGRYGLLTAEGVILPILGGELRIVHTDKQ